MFLRKYGTGSKIYFNLFDTDGVDFKSNAVYASGDIILRKDDGTESLSTNGFVDEGTGYSLTLTDSELEAKTITIYIIDQNTKGWLDTSVIIETYGDENARHVLDLAESMPDQIYNTLLTGATYNIPTSAGRRIRQATSSIIISGTSPGTGNTAYRIELDTDASNLDGAYDPAIISIVSGTGAGQSRAIYEYDGTNRYAYVNREWRTNPDSTSEYIVSPYAGEAHVNEGVLRSGSSTTAQLNELASTIDNVYNNQVLFISAGTGEDQAKLIKSYNGSTQTVTIFGTFDIQPDETSVYAILPFIFDLSEIKGDTYSSTTDSLEAISDAIAGISGGGGSNTVTITVQDELTIAIPEARIEIWNEDASVYLQGGYTNSSGVFTASRDDGTYTVKVRKAGWSFSDPFTLVVSGDTSQTYEGTEFYIDPPSGGNVCRMYEFCYKPDSTTPLTEDEVSNSTIKIISLPENLNGVTLSGEIVPGTFNSSNNTIYWDVAVGATVLISIPTLGINFSKKIPLKDTVRVMEM